MTRKKIMTIKTSGLRELAAKWDNSSLPSGEPENGSPDAVEHNAKMEGFRTGMQRCSEELKTLIFLLSDDLEKSG